MRLFSGFGGGGGVLLKMRGPRSSSGFGGGSSAVIWGSGCCAPGRVEKTFLKKKFFCGALCLKKKSWAFSFKRAVFWRPSFQRKVFLKKFFACYFTGWRRLRSQPSGSFLAAVALKCVLQKIAVIRGAAFPLKFNFFSLKCV